MIIRYPLLFTFSHAGVPKFIFCYEEVGQDFEIRDLVAASVESSSLTLRDVKMFDVASQKLTVTYNIGSCNW